MRISVVLVRISVVLVRISVVLVPASAGFSYRVAANCHPASSTTTTAVSLTTTTTDRCELDYHNHRPTNHPTPALRRCLRLLAPDSATAEPARRPEGGHGTSPRDAGMPFGVAGGGPEGLRDLRDPRTWGPPEEGMQPLRWTYWVVKLFIDIGRRRGPRKGPWELHAESWLRDLILLEALIRRLSPETGGFDVRRRIQLEQWTWTAEEGWQEGTEQV